MTSTKPASPAATRIQQFLLKGYHGVPTSGTVTIRHFNRDERVRRALAGLGKWWGVAVVSDDERQYEADLAKTVTAILDKFPGAHAD